MSLSLAIIIMAVIVASGVVGLGVCFIGHELRVEDEREAAEL
jgi:hypothetical protein